MKVISQHALNGLSQNCRWSVSYKGFIVKTEVRASIAKDNRSGNWNISWVWAHPPVCHKHYSLANRALDGNKVFTFPFGSGRWIIPAIDIISANKESCLGLAARVFKVMKVAGAWDHPWPRVKGVEWLFHSHIPCSDEWTDPPSSAAGTSPGSHLTNPHKWCSVQGTSFGKPPWSQERRKLWNLGIPKMFPCCFCFLML